MSLNADPNTVAPSARVVTPLRDAPHSRGYEALARAVQVIDYAFAVLYSAIGFEFALELFAARDRNGFKQFLDAVTRPFLGPFRTLLPEMVIGGSEVIFSYAVALVAYVMLHVGIHALARMVSRPPTEI